MDTNPIGTPNTHDAALKLLEDLNLTNIPDEQKEALLSRISALIDEAVVYAVMSRLTDKDVADLESVLAEQGQDNPLNEQTYEFLQSRIPNLQEIVEEAMASVYDRLKETSDILAS